MSHFILIAIDSWITSVHLILISCFNPGVLDRESYIGLSSGYYNHHSKLSIAQNLPEDLSL